MRRRLPILLIPALIAAAVGLAGCASSSASSPESTASAEPASVDDAYALDSCPLSALPESGKGMSAGSVDDLPFPGDPSLLDGACVGILDSASVHMVFGIVPGDAELAVTLRADLEAAGYTTVVTNDGFTAQVLGTEKWIVGDGDTVDALTPFLGDSFGDDAVAVYYITPPSSSSSV